MEGCFIDEELRLTRVDADRILRSYSKMNSVARSSRAISKSFCEQASVDEAAIHAQMYTLRAQVLMVKDVPQRMLLYHHYIKGHTLIQCAKMFGISRRSVYRLKNRALESIIEIMKGA